MTNWEQWQGRTVEGKYLLRNYLGGSEGWAVFRTASDQGRADAVIKFIAAEDSEAERQLRRWEAARELSHPNLIRILATGRTVVDEREFLYAVEEFAEENLAQIVPERSLTADEACGMLGPVIAALEYIHSNGFVHGHIRPANILASGDQVKLSSGSLRKTGEVPRSASVYDAPEVAAHGVSAASDVWSLGVTLEEVMTQHVPAWDAARMSAPEVNAGVPEPVRSIVQGCLEIDPGKRWSLREIHERLESGATASTTGTAATTKELAQRRAAADRLPGKWPYWIAGIAVLGVVILLIARPWLASGPESGSASVQSRNGGTTSTASRPAPQPETAPSSPPAPVVTVSGAAAATAPNGKKPAVREEVGAAKNGSREAAPKDEIVERVTPEVLPSARRTIEGRIRVRVKVDVDSDGNVSEAALTDAGPSRYFSRISLEAARRWKFAPAREQDEERNWSLLFIFSRARTEALAARGRANR